MYLATPLLASAMVCWSWWWERLLVQVAGVSVLLLHGIFLTSLHHTMPWDGPFLALCAVALVAGVALGCDARLRRAALEPERPALEPLAA